MLETQVIQFNHLPRDAIEILEIYISMRDARLVRYSQRHEFDPSREWPLITEKGDSDSRP
jgi:hypothetical protein